MSLFFSSLSGYLILVLQHYLCYTYYTEYREEVMSNGSLCNFNFTAKKCLREKLVEQKGTIY
jgi:hypothetical protein